MALHALIGTRERWLEENVAGERTHGDGSGPERCGGELVAIYGPRLVGGIEEEGGCGGLRGKLKEYLGGAVGWGGWGGRVGCLGWVWWVGCLG